MGLFAGISSGLILWGGGNGRALLLWLPLSFVCVTHAGRTLWRLLEARGAWQGMKDKHAAAMEAQSLGELQRVLERWRREYKRGGAQMTVAVARMTVAASAAPVVFACVVAHVLLFSVEQARFKISALLACVLLDVAIAAILYVAGEITEIMSSQREFFINVRLRVAEACYQLSEPTEDDEKNLVDDVRQLHLFNAIQTEIMVLEGHTSGQSFVVFGFSIDSGRVSHFLALVAAVLQHNFSTKWLEMQYGVDSMLVLLAFLLNALYLAYRFLRTRFHSSDGDAPTPASASPRRGILRNK